ncbi:MAG: ABC transporter permease [Stappiaceae bacterium]
MGGLTRTYGKGLTGVIVGLVVIWVLLMIVVPQFRMLERAFTFVDRGGDTAMLALQIDRAYSKKFTIDQEIAELEADGAGGDVGTTPTAPSPFAPSPSKPGEGGDGSQLSDEERTAKIAALAEESAALQASITELESQESQNSEIAGTQERYSFENFTTMSSIHLRIFIMTLIYAFCVTICSFLICYPVAFVAATLESKNKLTLIMLGLVIPYAINELLRIFSWVMILEKNGILNSLFDTLGILDLSAGEGIRFVASNGAVFTVMIYAYVLFMVFPIYNTIDTLDKNQIEAARDLGASAWKIHTRVVIPHAKPGIAVGSIMTFMLSAGSIAAPEIVGRGLHPDWFSQLIYRRFFEADSWNQGSAYSLALLAACIAFIFINMAIFKVGIRDIAK